MKALLLALIFSTSIFAQKADEYIGAYTLSNTQGSESGDAVVDRSDNQYEVMLNWTSAEARVGFYEKKISLKVNTNGQLSGETRDECEDPGCCWLDQVSVHSSKKNSSQLALEIDYSGYCYLEDGSDKTEAIEGSLLYLKNHK